MSERKYLDCREHPSENNCDLTMAGSEEHLLEAGVHHAVRVHGHEDTPQLREQLGAQMKEVSAGVAV